jgi:AcrR family transcriptional regulator
VLEAAKRIISERGLAALTWDSVAAESGEYRSAIRYHFGDRAGLLAAVVDSTALSSGTTPLFAAVLDVEPGPRRVAVHLSALAAVSADREQFRLFWALLPHVLNDPVLGGRLASLYDGYVRINREALGAEAESAEDERRLAAVARLLTAACDGLGLMTCLPDTGEKTAEEVAAAYAVLGELVESYLWGPGAPARAQRETEGP